MGWMLRAMGGPGLKNLGPCHLYFELMKNNFPHNIQQWSWYLRAFILFRFIRLKDRGLDFWWRGELFLLATTHAKVANSSNGKMVIARYRICYLLKKKSGSPANATGKLARYSSSLLPSSGNQWSFCQSVSCSVLWFIDRACSTCHCYFEQHRLISTGTTFRQTSWLPKALGQTGRQKEPRNICGSESDERPPTKSEWTWWKWMEHTFTQFFRFAVVAADGPTIWTSTYGLEPVLCNRLLFEPSGWVQTVHMFTQRFTYHMTQYSRRSLNAFAFFFSSFCACIYDLAEPYLLFFVGSAVSELSSGWSINCFLRYVCCCIIVKDKSPSVLMVDKCCRFAS